MKKWIVGFLAIVCALALAAGYGKLHDFPTKAEIAAMTDQEATEALAGTSREALLKAWGEPDGMLSGMFGDIYDALEDKFVIVYYDHYASENSQVKVESVCISDR